MAQLTQLRDICICAWVSEICLSQTIEMHSSKDWLAPHPPQVITLPTHSGKSTIPRWSTIKPSLQRANLSIFYHCMKREWTDLCTNFFLWGEPKQSSLVLINRAVWSPLSSCSSLLPFEYLNYAGISAYRLCVLGESCVLGLSYFFTIKTLADGVETCSFSSYYVVVNKA